MRKTIYETAHTALYYHPDLGIVHHEIRGYLNGEPFRTLLSRGADLIIAHGGRKWLSDDRGHAVLSPEDEAWAKTQWFPRMQAAGWSHWAIVKPANAVGNINLKRFAREYAALGITAQLFSDPETALTWLTDQQS